MTAKITPERHARILSLRKRGMTFTEIETETGTGRHTVAKYCAKADRAKSVKEAPAAKLTAEDVAWLRDATRVVTGLRKLRDVVEAVADAFGTVRCALCGDNVTVLRSQTEAGCRTCKARLNVGAMTEGRATPNDHGRWRDALIALAAADIDIMLGRR